MITTGIKVLLSRHTEGDSTFGSPGTVWLYDAEDPLVVSVTVEQSDGVPVTWDVSRDTLLEVAVHGRQAGEVGGDFWGAPVTHPGMIAGAAQKLPAWKGGPLLMFHMAGEGWEVHMYVPGDALAAFLDETLASVPSGTETYDIDGVIARIFAHEGAV